MKDLWIGVVEVLTEPSPGTGNTLAFTNVVTWAEGEADFVDSVNRVFSGYGWTVLGVEKMGPIPSDAKFSRDIGEIVAQATTNPDACIFSAFHYYPSRPA